jgi:glycosyltransferase involved in cell wall biosynthesis
MNPLVSVVLPVFNGEEFLNRSIKSFLNQTLEEIELIIVNDGSTDNTQVIIDHYAREDNRIKIIKLDENRGSHVARKTGTMTASGDYIMFLDADDALFINACKVAWLRATETNADIFQFNTEIVLFEEIFGNIKKTKSALISETSPIMNDLQKRLEPFDGTLTGERILRGCYEQNLFYYSVWNKIYRREICQKGYSHIPDFYLNLGEDDLAFFFIAYYSAKYVGDPRLTLYYYSFGSGISTQNSVSLKRIQLLSKCMEIPKTINKFLLEEGKVDYFKTAYESIVSRYKQATFYFLEQYINKENCSNISVAFTSVLEYFEPLELIQYLAPKFYEKPSIVAEGLLKSDLTKPIHKPIKTIGTYYFRLKNGGVERILSLIIPLWVEMGYRVVLFTDEPANDMDYTIDASYTRVVLPKSTSFTDYPNKVLALDSALRKYEVDLLVYHKWADPDMLWDLLVCKQANCAFYIYAHGTIDFFRYADFYSQQYFIQLPMIYELADCVIALTEMDTAFWDQFSNRTFQIANPIVLPEKEVQPRFNQGNRIIWVGRISEEKQPVELIKILASVLETVPNVELFIVGDGEPSEVNQLIDYAKKLKILDHITLVGFQLDVEQFYEQSDVLLFTSKYEGFGMSLLEAQSFGLPIVMYELPYLELVNGCNGIIAVDQLNVEEAGNAIVEVLTDQSKYTRLSEEAYKNAKRFSEFDLKKSWREIFSTTNCVITTDKERQSSSALRLALSSWVRFNYNKIQTPNFSEAVNQAVQLKMLNMSIIEAAIHLMKTLARRILGKEISEKIHLFRVRMRGKTGN